MTISSHTKDAIQALMDQRDARIAVLSVEIAKQEATLETLKGERSELETIAKALRDDLRALFP